MNEELEQFDITLMMHAPPEHIAHVINSACLYSGLMNKDIKVNWITMNPRNPDDFIYPFNLLEDSSLNGLITDKNLKIANLAKYIKDEFNPNIKEINDFLTKFKTKVLYLHYYTPFWEPLVLACNKKGIRVGLHVQNFDRNPNDVPFFQNTKGAKNAIQRADFLTVSQDRDISPTISLANKNFDQITVLPKAIPPIPLKNANLLSEISKEIRDVFSDDILTFTYLGRLEEFKNITWFLKHCLPHLDNKKAEFQILIVGCGSMQEEINTLASNYRNVYVFNRMVKYEEGLQIVKQSDLFLFFSGFDYSPRIPLEAILLGTPLIIGNFEFNKRYLPYTDMVVDSEKTNTCCLEYSNQEIEYGIPHKEQTITMLLNLMKSDNPNKTHSVDGSLLEESSPNFGAKKLLDIAFTRELK